MPGFARPEGTESPLGNIAERITLRVGRPPTQALEEETTTTHLTNGRVADPALEVDRPCDRSA